MHETKSVKVMSFYRRPRSYQSTFIKGWHWSSHVTLCRKIWNICFEAGFVFVCFWIFFIPSLSYARQPASRYPGSILLPAKLTWGRVALSPGHCCILVLSVQAVHASARALTSNYFYSNYFWSCIAPSPHLYIHTHKHTLTFGAPQQAATGRGGSGWSRALGSRSVFSFVVPASLTRLLLYFLLISCLDVFILSSKYQLFNYLWANVAFPNTFSIKEKFKIKTEYTICS